MQHSEVETDSPQATSSTKAEMRVMDMQPSTHRNAERTGRVSRYSIIPKGLRRDEGNHFRTRGGADNGPVYESFPTPFQGPSLAARHRRSGTTQSSMQYTDTCSEVHSVSCFPCLGREMSTATVTTASDDSDAYCTFCCFKVRPLRRVLDSNNTPSYAFSLPYPKTLDSDTRTEHMKNDNGLAMIQEGMCEDIEPVDVIWSRNQGDPKWRCIVFAMENLAKIYSGEFLFGSETVAWMENPECGSEIIVLRNEKLKQVLHLQ